MRSFWYGFPTNHLQSDILAAKGADDQNEKIANQEAAAGKNPLCRLAMARNTGRTTDQKGKTMEKKTYRELAKALLDKATEAQALIAYEYLIHLIR